MHSKKTNIINEVMQDIENLEDTMLYKKEKYFKKSHRDIRICPHPSSFDYKIYKDLKEVIICNDLSIVSIKRWDELEIDFNNQNEKYSKELNQNIIKVTNKHNYNEIKNSNVSIAIPYKGILQKTLIEDIQEYIKNYVFIQISRRLIQESDYREEYDIKENNMKTAIQFIISYINEDIKKSSYADINSWIESYKEFDVDLNEIIIKNRRQ